MARTVGIALAGLALTLIALMFDAAPLFVPGIGFAVLGVAAPTSVWLASRRAQVHRDLDQRRVIEGDPLEASIVVERGWSAATVGELLEPLAPATFTMPRWKRRETVRVVLRFHRRGRRQLEPPSLIVRDPLELCRRAVTGEERRSELLVLPRTSRVEVLKKAAGGQGSLAESTRHELPAAVEIDGLRPYRAGTPASRIHWPAVARGHGLLERRLQAESDTRPLVVLDARASGCVEHLDAAVRAAASLALELAGSGGCSLLLPGDRRPTSLAGDLSAWPAAHARLALVAQSSSPPSMTSARARSGAVFYVTAQALDRLPPAVEGTARGVSVLVLPAALEAPGARSGRPMTPRFAVAGCLGYVLSARSSPRGPARALGSAA